MRRLEWSTEPFRASGTAEEASVAGLRLTTRGVVRPGAAARAEAATARAEAAEAGEGAAAPALAGGVLAVEGRVPLAEGARLRPRGQGRLRPGRGRGDGARQPGRRPRLARRARGRQRRGTRPRGHLRHGGRPREGRGHPRERGAGRGALPGPRGDRGARRARASSGAASSRPGRIPLAPLEPGRSARLHFEATDVDLSRFAVPAAQRAADSPSFLASVSGDFEATAPALASLRGEGQFTRLESRSNEGTFGLAAPATWRLADGRLVQEPLRLAGPLGTLEASAEVVLVGTPGGSAHLLRPLRPAPREPVRARHHARRPGERRPAREVGRARARSLEGRLAVDGGRVTPGHAELQRLAAEGRGALPRRPRGDRRDRRGGRRARSSPTAG